MEYPDFNESRTGLSLLAKPPFDFQGVTIRVFPLRANVHRLATFCNSYLNIVPDEIALFRPSLPYVFLSVINYGKMSVRQTNLGWVSQNEVAFCVFLDWYQRKDGRLVFKDWASIAPFIFVDDYVSLTTGREVFGWPKVTAELEPAINPWTRHPRNDRRLMTLSTLMFPEVYAGRRQLPKVLLEINHDPPPRLSLLPLLPPWASLDDLADFLSSMPSPKKAFQGAFSLVQDMVEAFVWPQVPAYNPVAEETRSPLPKLRNWLQNPKLFTHLNTITLKQFRDAEDPKRICYQSLINAKLKMRRYNRGGLLGSLDLLRGDPAAGFDIKIHRYMAQPIIESLGIEVAQEQQADGHSVATVKPVLPFWVDADLHYSAGEALCWRTGASWHDAGGKLDETAPSRAALYNTARGAATHAAADPSLFPNVTSRVLPLMADQARLEQFCNNYLKNDAVRFRPYGSYVYLIVTSFDADDIAQQNDIGWWAEHEVGFFVPLQWYDGKENLVSLALVAPYVFADSNLYMTSNREVNGRPVVLAKLKAKDLWADEVGPKGDRQLLTVETKVLPVLNLGQKSEERVLLEVIRGDILPSGADQAWGPIADRWTGELARDLRKKRCAGERRRHLDCLKGLALELLAGKSPLNEVALKQFRDACEPKRACYQAIVQSKRVIEDLFELREIEDKIHVRVHRYPSEPIVDVLGLKVKRTEAGESELCGRVWQGAAVDTLEAIRPFWARFSMRTEPSTNIWSTAQDLLRRPASRAPLYWEQEGDTGVAQGLAAHLDAAGTAADGSPKDLRRVTRSWAMGQELGKEARCDDAGQVKRITRQEAKQAVAEIEPQVVVESILSHGWGGGQKEPKPEFYIRSDSAGDVGMDLLRNRHGLTDEGPYCVEAGGKGRHGAREIRRRMRP